MNLALVEELADYFEGRSKRVLVLGDSIPEIQQAAHRHGLKVRVIGPKEFSLPAIFEAQRKNLLGHRDDPAAVGFWTGLKQALGIPSSVQVLVVRDIDQLDDTHDAALESVLKGDMDRPEEGLGFDYVWATATSLTPHLSSRLAGVVWRTV